MAYNDAMKKEAVILIAAGLFSAGSWASCYKVLGPKGEVLSESTNPPVNMAYPLHLSVPERFGPGAVLVFGIADGNCGARIDPSQELHPVKMEFPAESSAGQQGKKAPRRDRH
ncbi:hypothetical protein [Ottowia thiooxydans]|uniref:hypothetical protein n=1 Tax=Ottowia thiooxydans TaxID=219182 RepID=UPI0004127D63|nr:hypothetical protein [Ottowia thiooxydans]